MPLGASDATKAVDVNDSHGAGSCLARAANSGMGSRQRHRRRHAEQEVPRRAIAHRSREHDRHQCSVAEQEQRQPEVAAREPSQPRERERVERQDVQRLEDVPGKA